MGLENLVGEGALNEIKGREFGIDPNSRYSEKAFLERAEDLFRVDIYHKKIMKNSTDMEALNELARIALKYMPGDKEENLKLLKDPSVAEKQAKVLLNSGYKNMVSYAARNLVSLLNEMSEESLIETAAILPDKNKPYAQIVQYMQVGDMKKARKIYAETFGNAAWKNFILECPSEELIQNKMAEYISSKQKEFIDQNLSIRVENGKESIYKPNLNKVREYITKTIAKYGDKEKQVAYMGIATALYHSKKDVVEEMRNAA